MRVILISQQAACERFHTKTTVLIICMKFELYCKRMCYISMNPSPNYKSYTFVSNFSRYGYKPVSKCHQYQIFSHSNCVPFPCSILPQFSRLHHPLRQNHSCLFYNLCHYTSDLLHGILQQFRLHHMILTCPSFPTCYILIGVNKITRQS
jgi:hypothetical protein